MRLPAVAFAVTVSTVAALAEPSSTKGTVKYQLAGAPELYDAPAPACKASAADLTKHGNKQAFLRVDPGTDDGHLTCVLVNTDLEQWSQTDFIDKKMFCSDGKESVSMDNTGTWESQGCPCDPVTGCPPAGTGSGSGNTQKGATSGSQGSASESQADSVASPKAPGAADACGVFASDSVCTSSAAQQGAERSARCTQSAAHKVTKAVADKLSRENKKKATAKDKKLLARWVAARLAIDEMVIAAENKKDPGGSKGEIRSAWARFSSTDLCEGINDVNIGTLCGTHAGDFAAANNLVGLAGTPKGCVWHHHSELGRMQLVKKSAYSAIKTAIALMGGAQIWMKVYGLTSYPTCCPALQDKLPKVPVSKVSVPKVSVPKPPKQP